MSAFFLNKLLMPKSFGVDFLLMSNEQVETTDFCRIVMSEGICRDQFLAWIEALSDRLLAWLGLPTNGK